ncbi:MAG: type II CAAX prenyl endopeptidase Rce1 family protein [Bacteroidota bacterium]
MLRYLKLFTQFPPIKAIIGYFFCMGLLGISQRLVLKPLIYMIIDDVAIADTLRISLAIVWLLACYGIFVKYFERRKAAEIDFANWKKEIVAGVALGFGCISLSISILYLLGNYQFIGISFAGYNAKVLVILLLAALIEDLLHRGLILRILEQWLGTYLALALAVSIEMQHFANPNIEFSFTELLLFVLWGFTLGLMYVYTKRIWLPFAFHIGWNFAQPFYGSNLTGLDDMGKIIDARFVGSESITGGAVGIEGSVFTILILFTLSATFLYLSIKGGKIVKSKIAWLPSI